MRCDRCAASYVAGSLWCPSCGVWASDVAGLCEGDELEQATGACVVCGVPVCAACGIEADGRRFCNDRSHQDIARTYGLLDNYASAFEADWVSRNLDQAGVQNRVFGFRGHPGLHGCDLVVEAVLFVLQKDMKKAQEVLQAYDSKKGA